MTKRDIVIFLFKRAESLLGYWFFVIALSTFLVYSLPQKYDAMAKVLVESNRAPLMRSDMTFGVENMSVLNSHTAIIRSKPVLTATAARIEAYQRVKARKAEREAAEESPPSLLVRTIDRIGQWMIDVGLRETSTQREVLIRDLQDLLKIEPQPNSNIITISYRSIDPELAALVVNTVTKNYINRHLEIFSTGGTSKLYSRQIERLENDLRKQREKRAEYKRDKSVAALSETRGALVQQKSKLTAELSQIERELAELRTRFSEGHTKLVLVQGRLQSTRRLLSERENNLQKLEIEEATIRDMEIEIQSIEMTLLGYKKLFQDEQLTSLANPDVVNIQIIENASVPTRPNHSRLYYIVLATIGGLLLSFAIAFIKEYLDHRVTDPAGNFQAAIAIVIEGAIRAGYSRYAGLFHRLNGGDLVAHKPDGFRRGADESEATFFHLFGKVGILGEKAVAGVDSHSVGDLGGRDDGRYIQVAVGRRGRADAH